MEDKDRKARVSGWEKDGKFVTILYTQEDGQRVSADFERIGWRKPPAEILAKTKEALDRGPIHVIGRRAGPR